MFFYMLTENRQKCLIIVQIWFLWKILINSRPFSVYVVFYAYEFCGLAELAIFNIK